MEILSILQENRRECFIYGIYLILLGVFGPRIHQHSESFWEEEDQYFSVGSAPVLNGDTRRPAPFFVEAEGRSFVNLTPVGFLLGKQRKKRTVL